MERLMKRNSIPLLVVLLAGVMASAETAQNRKREIREMKATGCVRKAGEGGCLLLRTLDGKTTYNIFASPQPDPGIVITIEGKQHSGPTTCMQGIPIDVTKWEETGEKCAQ
jgi:hypothetical protein